MDQSHINAAPESATLDISLPEAKLLFQLGPNFSLQFGSFRLGNNKFLTLFYLTCLFSLGRQRTTIKCQVLLTTMVSEPPMQSQSRHFGPAPVPAPVDICFLNMYKRETGSKETVKKLKICPLEQVRAPGKKLREPDPL